MNQKRLDNLKAAATGMFAGLTIINFFYFMGRLFSMSMHDAAVQSITAYLLGLLFVVVAVLLAITALSISDSMKKRKNTLE